MTSVETGPMGPENPERIRDEIEINSRLAESVIRIGEERDGQRLDPLFELDPKKAYIRDLLPEKPVEGQVLDR